MWSLAAVLFPCSAAVFSPFREQKHSSSGGSSLVAWVRFLPGPTKATTVTQLRLRARQGCCYVWDAKLPPTCPKLAQVRQGHEECDTTVPISDNAAAIPENNSPEDCVSISEHRFAQHLFNLRGWGRARLCWDSGIHVNVSPDTWTIHLRASHQARTCMTREPQRHVKRIIVSTGSSPLWTNLFWPYIYTLHCPGACRGRRKPTTGTLTLWKSVLCPIADWLPHLQDSTLVRRTAPTKSTFSSPPAWPQQGQRSHWGRWPRWATASTRQHCSRLTAAVSKRCEIEDAEEQLETRSMERFREFGWQSVLKFLPWTVDACRCQVAHCQRPPQLSCHPKAQKTWQHQSVDYIDYM